MPKPSSGSNRYLKAQLRPLTKPVFWASAGLFGLSLFALFSLFRQPDEVLSSGDRDAVVNLDENDSLTPEERARAAEIDDLSVLLKDLDKTKTIDSVSGRLNDTQTTNLEAPEAIADLDSSQTTSPIKSSGSNFEQLPLLDLNPQIQDYSNGTPTSNSGFVGFDPRSSGQVGGNPPSPGTTITPLAAALAGNSSTGNSAAASNSTSGIEGSSSSINTAAATTSQRSGILSNGVEANGSPTYTAPISSPTLTAPDYSNSQSLIQQNSSNNAYGQTAPNLAVPTAPLSATPITPVLPVQPASSGVSSPLGQPQTNLYNNGAIAPSSTTQSNLYNSSTTSLPASYGVTTTSTPQTQAPVFGAPSSQAIAPTPSNPAPYSVPNSTPGQYSGNGQINTFANP